ncbi:P-loop containing nucleoside triphosphate hydrolase protein [Penicillium malachiteum]|uniref:P-loop containing nucleoside triphosphate hydrolase protein n=1 Tax=Penicillium malachiteum TaxID=1324776 RepID=UPI0025498340|nr:P-loop containing nucleoside triphosphate hydrolase protein [Penicillium malachiteum]KAJ5735718.1 P-loop containing nucleoside triphosphate hydrolase protein [Penicillium malachiteum]
MPTDLTVPAENSESSQYALIVRYAKSYSFSRNLSVNSISIQSDHVKKFLGGVFRGYPGTATTLQRVEFHSPFTSFIHRWDRLIKAKDEITDPTTKEHVDLLHEIIYKEIASNLSEKQDLVKNGVIMYCRYALSNL